jgi:hypothetical protein
MPYQPVKDTELKERLITAVCDILDRATTLSDPRVVEAARELGLELQSVSIRRAEHAFLDTMEPLHESLEAPIGTRERRLAVQTGRELLERLAVAGEPPEVKRERFIECFQIRTGEHKVRVDIGGLSPLGFLRRANSLALDLLGRTAIYSPTIDFMSRYPEGGGTHTTPPNTIIAVNGHLPCSIGGTFEDHRAARVAHVPLPTIMVAHAAYTIATARDLFNGIAVRAGWPSRYAILVNGPAGLATFLGLESMLAQPIGGAIQLLPQQVSGLCGDDGVERVKSS